MNAFQTIRAAHDSCDHDDIPEAAEDALHEFEDACAASDCNVASTETVVCSASMVYGQAITVLLGAVIAILHY
jgi:hypothetical protein